MNRSVKMMFRNLLLTTLTLVVVGLLHSVCGIELHEAESKDRRSLTLDVLSAIPQAIVLNVTKNVTISCSVPENLDVNLTSVYSLEIYFIKDGHTNLLATIHADDGFSVKPGATQAYTAGSLDDDANFLDLTWSNPGPEVTGVYTCDGTGVGSDHFPVFFTNSLELGTREASYEELTHELQKLTTEKEKAEKALKDALNKITLLEGNQCLRSCEDVVLGPGMHVAKLTPDDKLGPITALCEVEENGQIWTIFQRRFDGSVDFYRNSSDYENGFGSIEGEFWLGLSNIRRLLLQNGDNNTLRVDMSELKSDANYTREYPVFSVGPANGYRLTVGGFDDRGHGMTFNSGSNFSTYDQDFSDGCPELNRRAGWWFPFLCGYVNLNGMWGVENGTTSMFWHEFRGDNNHPMGMTELKFRMN